MKKLLIATAAAAVLFAPQAFAQAKNFAGFTVGANVISAKSTSTATAIRAGGLSADDSGTNAAIDLQASYGWAFGQQFVMGVGVTLGTSANKAGTLGTSELTVKDRASLDFMPGFAVSDTVLVFGKLSALTATAEGTAGLGSKSLSGLGYGIGLRAMMNKNLFLQGGYDLNTYDKFNAGAATSVEGKAGILSAGVGYKF